jgi:GNAT superfamily N-acetyltransferase
MKIKQASLKDIDSILGLWIEFHEAHHEDMIKKERKNAPHLKKKPDAVERFRMFIQKKLLEDDAYIQIAYEKEIAGYSICFIESNTPIYEIEKIGYFSDLYIKEKFRGAGLASRFKDNAEKWMKKKGVRYASIKLYPKNKKAHEIYKHWGFFDFHLEMRKVL